MIQNNFITLLEKWFYAFSFLRDIQEKSGVINGSKLLISFIKLIK